jgi:hypothetical protein
MLKEIKEVDGFFVDRIGRKFKTRNAAKYLNYGECWMWNSGQSQSYVWKKRYCMMVKGLGYIKMAAELEPYNPDIMLSEGFNTGHKSCEYMINLTKDLISRSEKSVENGYEPIEERTLGMFRWALKDLQRKVKKGELMDGKW